MIDLFKRLRRRSKTLREFHSQAREVQRITGRSVLTQVVEWLQLRREIGLSDREYFLYELYRSDIPYEEKRQYLSAIAHAKRNEFLLPPAYIALLDDKFIFRQYYSSLGFPLPESYGIFHPFHGRTASGAPLRNATQLRDLINEVPERGLVVKHAMSGSGRWVMVFDCVTGGPQPLLKHVNGNRFTFEQLTALLSPEDPSTHPGFILDERVQQHPFLERLNPATLHTTRVVTIMATNGSVHIIGAALKIGFDNSGVESLVEKNLSSPVDVETGRLGPVAHRDGIGFRRATHHPGTGIRIEGEVIPHWPQIKQLAFEAALAARCVRSVGWDIGLSINGPVLIEGNQEWGAEVLQIPFGRGICTPDVRAILDQRPYISSNGRHDTIATAVTASQTAHM
jgi:hypothetical protein